MPDTNQNNELNFRIKHTNYIITNVERTIKFYSDAFGMRLLERVDADDLRLSLIFIGYGDIETTTILELTYNWDAKPLDMGVGYKHICIGTNDVVKAFDRAINSGASVVLRPFTPSYADRKIAFVRDPDGYEIELMQDQ